MAMGNIHLTAGMRSNLVSMQSTAKLMDSTQSKLSSGLKVQSALDDPINFFKAQEHRNRANDLDSRKDAMSEAVQTVKAANNGIEGLSDLLAQAKSLAQSARSANSTDAAQFSTQFDEVVSQMDTLAGDSGYKGINLLDGTDDQLKVVFDANGDNSITLTGFAATSGGDLTISAVADGEANDWVAGLTTTTANIDTSLSQIDSANNALRTQSKVLSSKLNIITTRDEWATSMINTLEEGADKLTLADMNEEGANMMMLQTRQQLGTTSLSIASQAAQAVLRLF
jgi:flagellin-like hook-associated protein FlgL